MTLNHPGQAGGGVTPQIPVQLAAKPTRQMQRTLARKIKAALEQRKLTYKAAAEEIAVLMVEGTISTVSVWQYAHGRAWPRPPVLAALCEALGVNPSELTEQASANSDDVEDDDDMPDPAVSVVDRGDGRAWIEVAQEVSWADALQILVILKGAGP
jgi:transcriptional regulator with XRE-family HTH domain